MTLIVSLGALYFAGLREGSLVHADGAGVGWADSLEPGGSASQDPEPQDPEPEPEPSTDCGEVEGYNCEPYISVYQVPLPGGPPNNPDPPCTTFTWVPDGFGNGKGKCVCDGPACVISGNMGCAGSGDILVHAPIGQHLVRPKTGECVNGPGSIYGQLTWANSWACPWPLAGGGGRPVLPGSHAEFEVRSGSCGDEDAALICRYELQGSCNSCGGDCP
ncbi:MAG: hypothetical protein ACE37K_02190 [Planctomycetota bacterium]